MSDLDALLDDLVIANRILARENVVDAFGHVSIRHPDRPDRYFLARSQPPDLIVRADIMEFELDGTPVDAAGRKPYLERYIHGALYEARPDVGSVIHSHSRSVIPFTVTQMKLRPLLHSCATMGRDVPVWDAQNTFGDTDLLITSMDMGRDLAGVFGGGRSVLMRGHGSTVSGATLREAVYTAVYMEVNAGIQLQAGQLGPIAFLTDGEIDKITARLSRGRPGEGYDRAWQYWARGIGIDVSERG